MKAEQQDLFSWAQSRVQSPETHAQSPETHAQSLHRVRKKIGWIIYEFCAKRKADGCPEFHAEELLAAVRSVLSDVAPDSPSRILRDLRRQGLVNYVLVNRRQSLYRLMPFRGEDQFSAHLEDDK